MKSNKIIGTLIILNVIFSQISNSFIFCFIESLFLELVEEFFIKILPDYFFSDEPYFNRSFALRIRDITVYDSSQTNITIWTSIIGAFIYYCINNKMSNQNQNEEKNQNNVNFSDIFFIFFIKNNKIYYSIYFIFILCYKFNFTYFFIVHSL